MAFTAYFIGVCVGILTVLAVYRVIRYDIMADVRRSMRRRLPYDVPNTWRYRLACRLIDHNKFYISRRECPQLSDEMIANAPEIELNESRAETSVPKENEAVG